MGLPKRTVNLMTADAKKKVKALLTPFGKIKILIDGKPIPYVAQRGRNLEGEVVN